MGSGHGAEAVVVGAIVLAYADINNSEAKESYSICWPEMCRKRVES